MSDTTAWNQIVNIPHASITPQAGDVESVEHTERNEPPGIGSQKPPGSIQTSELVETAVELERRDRSTQPLYILKSWRSNRDIAASLELRELFNSQPCGLEAYFEGGFYVSPFHPLCPYHKLDL